MSIIRVIEEIRRLSIIKTIYYNYLCPHVKRKNAHILVYKKCQLFFERAAKLNLVDGVLYLGRGYGCSCESCIRIQENSELNFTGNSIVEYGADILLKKESQLNISENNYFNCNLFIRCHKQIDIGQDCYFASGVEIRDCDGHSINGELRTEPVSIGNHVWICSNVEVLRGVTIGDGAVIGAKSLVLTDIEKNGLAVGVPAVVKKKNVVWDA